MTGDVLAALGRDAEATAAWERAAASRGDFVSMATTEFSERSICSVHALRRLGREGEADDLARALSDWAVALRDVPAMVDYFATSLPTMLLFHEDLQRRRELTCDTIAAQAALALGDGAAAARLAADVLAVDPADPHALEVASAVSA
ncbi:hypothetical protein G7085_09125 [Tessaracoccus sp. HDW20]|uniref:hypothetical protein n=1 Tax=Tessaracoccus coleopterorum TaxID=2714950 RepID=UPI0018D4511C|nr:hypothetical protein [Tessaracoccus coleopterorum]NHB84720.1 hypothetical protein [Tessaracoccus coleopterorum]